jgi:uncharacterized Fe-S cluster protein YjdI/CDGSH-type Zn-finger protein
MTTRDYEGDGIVVHWDSERCLHSERCFTGAPTVFDPQARPWVQPDGLDADALAAVIDTCPSAALTYTRTDGGEHGRRGYAAGADPSPALVPDATPDHGGPTTGASAGIGGSVDTSGAVSITPRRNGPLMVQGPVTLTAPDGSTTVEERVFLCRCGHSATKPRCDGTHKRIGFEAPGVVPTSRSATEGGRPIRTTSPGSGPSRA